MANSKYATTPKGLLVDEIKSRRAKGRSIAVDLRSNEESLAAALDADDMENGEFIDSDGKPPEAKDPTIPPDDAEELTKKALQGGALARADGVVTREVPDDLHEYSGEYVYRVDGPMKGHIFGLKILSGDEVRANRTHHAKSPLGFWDGTAEEFRALFDKV